MTLSTLLCCFAHPDDETIMAGGTLAMLHAHGVRTHLLCATRGEGGERGDPPVVDRQEDLGAARVEELRNAALALGISELTLLGYVDPVVGPDDELGAFEADFPTLTRQIGMALRERGVNAVLAHGPDGEYGHPAHRLIYRAVLAAVQQYAPQLPFYSVAATVPGIDDHLWNKSRVAQFALDITPWAAAKIAAMECHISQHALFKRRRKLQTVAEALRPTESYYREWPDNGTSLPDDDFAALLQAAGAQPVTL